MIYALVFCVGAAFGVLLSYLVRREGDDGHP